MAALYLRAIDLLLRAITAIMAFYLLAQGVTSSSIIIFGNISIGTTLLFASIAMYIIEGTMAILHGLNIIVTITQLLLGYYTQVQTAPAPWVLGLVLAIQAAQGLRAADQIMMAFKRPLTNTSRLARQKGITATLKFALFMLLLCLTYSAGLNTDVLRLYFSGASATTSNHNGDEKSIEQGDDVVGLFSGVWAAVFGKDTPAPAPAPAPAPTPTLTTPNKPVLVGVVVFLSLALVTVAARLDIENIQYVAASDRDEIQEIPDTETDLPQPHRPALTQERQGREASTFSQTFDTGKAALRVCTRSDATHGDGVNGDDDNSSDA
ncbi:hypothetical protein PRZ48_010251 [Zasmidium cellare]|uniref:Uncharacterized protein n=1 Tax=Zasmidium cellare TaxID=395010 RepID=A0ABR0E833_ZASCE|nr:hypothetical protein PRZ48_010251 [Zasmidium cellare]